MHSIHLTLSSFFLLFAFFTSDWARPESTIKLELGTTLEPAGLYDQLYPYYAEYCGVTQYAPVKGKMGGRGGHATLYFKGLCRDPKAHYPRAMLCSEGSYDPSDPEAGLFISADAFYTSVNWVGFEGKTFFLKGILKEGERVTPEAVDQTIRTVLDRGYFRGVRASAEFMANKPSGISDEEYIVRESLGTDFAINYVRNSYCSRVPILKEMLPHVVDYLNAQNDPDETGQQNYEWKLLSNNCAHTTHNALASAGVWAPLKTDQLLVIQLLHLAIPANEFINLEQTGNDEPLDNIDTLFLDPIKSDNLTQWGWLPTQPGVVVEKIPARIENDLFHPNLTFGILDFPLFWPEHQRFKKILKKSRYNDIEANLYSFEAKYIQAKKKLLPLEELIDRSPGYYPEKFEAFYFKYKNYIDRELERVAQLKERLREFHATEHPVKLINAK